MQDGAGSLDAGLAGAHNLLSHETPMDTTAILSATTLSAGLLVLRLALGLYMAAHGAQKLFGWFSGYGLNATGEFMVQLGFKQGRAFATLASASEIASGLLVALGFLGPIGPALMISVMIVAMVTVHRKNGLFAAQNGIELPFLYASAGLALGLTGFGRFSLDTIFGLTPLYAPSVAYAALAIGIVGGLGSLRGSREGGAVSTRFVGSRRVMRTVTTAPPSPGFAGPGHTAVMVVDPAEFAANDPFIVLMDDRLELASGAHVGGEHPHAGFEIATFVVEGALIDRDEGVLRAGDLLWTRAGAGSSTTRKSRRRDATRILQLWRALPVEERWSAPWFETTTLHEAPVRREPGAEVVVYAGRSGDVEAPTGRHASMTLVDVRLERGASVEQEVPTGFAGFAYVLDGALVAGDDGAVLRAGQAGWLDVDARARATACCGSRRRTTAARAWCCTRRRRSASRSRRTGRSSAGRVRISCACRATTSKGGS